MIALRTQETDHEQTALSRYALRMENIVLNGQMEHCPLMYTLPLHYAISTGSQQQQCRSRWEWNKSNISSVLNEIH